MRKIFSILLVLIGFASCKEKYVSPFESPSSGYLVVEGTVNSGPGQTTIKLSRTTKLGSNTIVYERGADVKIEGENNAAITLSEKTPGNYSGDNLNLNSNIKYRLRVKTTRGKEYLSDYVGVKKNPPIDTVSWKREDDGLQLYVQSHDDQNKTLYYQWEYKETWEFHSFFWSVLKYQITHCRGVGCPTIGVVFRDPVTKEYDSTIVKCWQSDSTSNLQIGSTVKLSKDVVYLPLVFIPAKSWKLGVLYSVLVKQMTWTKEGYEYLEKLKKNTEITGSIFDAQPSELKGNFHNISDPTEPVVGFFNICNIEQKRFWIKPTEVPDWSYIPLCPESLILNVSDTIWSQGSDKIPTMPIEYEANGAIKKFAAGPAECVDCTLKGTNVKPVYWP